MARSKCLACGHSEFEAVPVVNKSGQKFCLVQCAACGVVVGAIDDVKVANVIRKAEKKLSRFLETITPAAAAMRKKDQQKS